MYFHFAAIASACVFAWALALGIWDQSRRRRHGARAWGRIWGVGCAAAGVFAAIAFFLNWGAAPGERGIGFQQSLQVELQLLAAWLAFPAGLRLAAVAGGGMPGSAALGFWGGPGWLRPLLRLRKAFRRNGRCAGKKGRVSWVFEPRPALTALLLGAGAAGISALILPLFHPALTPEALKFYSPGGLRAIGLFLMVLLAVPIEEVIFRLMLQSQLEVWLGRLAARWASGAGGGEAGLAAAKSDHGAAAWGAVALTSAIWSLGHAGIATPVGLKEGQIFLFGLLLGWMRRRGGLWGSLWAHAGLNLCACWLQAIEWLAR